MLATQSNPDRVALSIRCRDINVRFFTDRRSTTALAGLSLDVASGEFLTLLGPSGCGKSTFLRVVADLVKPSRGEIRVLDAAPQVARARRDIGFVFQDAALLPWRTALQNVELPLEVANGRARAAARPRATAGIGRLEGARGCLSARNVRRHAPAGGDCPRAGQRS